MEIKDALEAFASASGDEGSLADLKVSDAAKRTRLEKSLIASEEKMVDGDLRIKKFERINDTLDDLASRFDEAEANLETFEDHVRFIEDKVSKHKD